MGTEKRERQKQGRRERLEAAAQAQRRAAVRRRIITFAVIAVIIGGLITLYTVFAGDDGDDVATDTTEAPEATPDQVVVPPPPGPGEAITGETPCPEPDGSSPRTTSFENPPPMCLDPDRAYVAVFNTNLGEIRVALDMESTPETANNFAVLARYGYYDDTAIHRTDPSIDIIQGGSPTSNNAADPGPGYTITDEGDGFTYEEGQLVMARSAGPDSAGAQFFFVAGPGASALDAQGTYVVFGRVLEGLDIVKQILAMHQEDPTSGLGGAPAEPVIIESITIEELDPSELPAEAPDAQTEAPEAPTEVPPEG